MFSGHSSKKRDTDERSSVSTSSRHGHDKKKSRGEASRSSTPYSATHAPPPPSTGPPPEQSSEERILTPDEDDELSDDTHSVLFDEPIRPKGKETIVQPRQPTVMAPTPAPAPATSGVRGNAPDVFRGQGDNLDTFLTQCRLYFFLNQDKFDTEPKMTIFMISYMRETAYATFEARLGEFLGGTPSTGTQRLFGRVSNLEAELRLCFGSVDKKREAERELHRLKQHTSAKDYAANFQRITAGLGWNDESLMSQFYQGLKADVRIEVLRKEPQPSTLNDLIKISIKEDDLIYQINKEKKGQGPKRTFHRPNQGQSRNSPNYYGPKPMELDALQKKPKQHKNQKGGKTSTQKGKCYNCGKEGHYSNKCRQPKKRNPDGDYKNKSQSSFKSLQVVESNHKEPPKAGITAQLAMINVIGRNKRVYTFGPNQPIRNTAAVEVVLKTKPEVAEDYKHELHRILPTSECKDEECTEYTWEHRTYDDPGNPSWIFSGDEHRAHNTIRRRALEIEGVRKDTFNVHHCKIPMSCCQATDCSTHHRKNGQCHHWRMNTAPAEVRNSATFPMPPPALVPRQRAEPLPSMRRPAPRTTSKESLKAPHPLQWAKDAYKFEVDVPHRDLKRELCEKEYCVWHDRKPTPVPAARRLVERAFTPLDTESEQEEDNEDLFLEKIRTCVDDLMFEINSGVTYRLDTLIPHKDFDIALKVRSYPDKGNTKERFTLLLKAQAKEHEEESTTEEDDSETEEALYSSAGKNNNDQLAESDDDFGYGEPADVEIVHGVLSENEQDLWD